MSGQTQSGRKLRHELPEDIEFESSPNQMREFTQHLGWRDLRIYLEDHVLWCHNQMENIATLEEMRDLQGQIKTAKAVLGFPDYVIEQLEEEQDNAEGDLR